MRRDGPKNLRLLGVLVVGALVLGACSSSSATSTSASSSTTAPLQSTTWLCAPNLATDPCAGNIDTTAITATGTPTVTKVAVATKSPVDCFYLYGTVSGQKRLNATTEIQPAESAIAFEQAAPFSAKCTIYAPMYNQVTLLGLGYGAITTFGTQKMLNTAYDSALNGFKAFLARIPASHHFVLMGHSQGAAMLIRLIASEIDPNPALRARLVSALLIGGNLTVPEGKTVGAAFKHIPLCTSAVQQGCAVAYSTFLSEPPTDAFFGIPGQGVSKMWNQQGSAGLQVACVDPAQLLGLSPALDAEFANPGGGFVTYPGYYTGSCEHTATTTWLNVTEHPTPGATNNIPALSVSAPKWGLHPYDVNLAMGDLVQLVGRQIEASQ